MSGLYSVVDGIFIGKATGDTGLAAINIAWPVPAVITALGIGIGTGGSVLYSNYKGRGDVNSCQKILDNTMTCLMISAASTSRASPVLTRPAAAMRNGQSSAPQA